MTDHFHHSRPEWFGLARKALRQLKINVTRFHPDPHQREMARLRRMPRYQHTHATFFGKSLSVVDPHTFVGGYREIFEREIYAFRTANEKPQIIDCGANVGLSVIYFKKLYPHSHILAFEPDHSIFAALQHNVAAYHFTDVQLEAKAVWIHDQGVNFQQEGGFSGRIPKPGDTERIVSVPSVRLYDLLDTKIDFLKLDIEGAETEVLRDCQARLHYVEHLFVEYHSLLHQEQTLPEVLSIIKAAGFRYHVKEAFIRKHPFIEVNDIRGMDSQLNIFAYKDS
jgi:FkbM family methyltransferase